jgi:hypothetical protein
MNKEQYETLKAWAHSVAEQTIAEERRLQNHQHGNFNLYKRMDDCIKEISKIKGGVKR